MANGMGLGVELDAFGLVAFDDLSYYILVPILLKYRIPARFGYFTFGLGPEVVDGSYTSVSLHILAGFAFNAGPGYFILEVRGSTDFESAIYRDYVGAIIGYTFEF